MATILAPDAQPWSILKGKLHDGLLRGIDSMGYQYMTPVQQKVLSELPSLESDCLVQAKTGTGKTIAFLLTALQSLLTQASLPRGQVAILILSPTRELALQIAKECESVTSQLRPRPECHTAYGGTSKERDLKRFCDGAPSVLVATPGRLNDYLSDDFIADKFANLRTLVLDEADQMLDAGFLVAVNDILRRLPPKSRGWQGMCFSATIPKKMEGLLPKVLKSGYTRLSTVDPDEIPTIDSVTQHSAIVPSVPDVYPVLLAILQQEYQLNPQNFKVVVFGTTANGVALMYSLFSDLLGQGNPLKVFQLQSRLTQNARTRTTDEFKAASAGVMFASDVIGRGMDFPNVSLVVQIGLPSSGEQYVHRVGRTARAGNSGRAVILLTQRESFFLRVNKHLPITPYPYDLSAATTAHALSLDTALAHIDETTKGKAYRAWLGFHKTFTKQLQLTNEGLVQEANAYAAAIGCPEPPPIDKRTVGKMGLKGVRGLNISAVIENGGSGGGGGRNHAGRTQQQQQKQPNGRGTASAFQLNPATASMSSFRGEPQAGASNGGGGGGGGGRGGRGRRDGRGGRVNRGGRGGRPTPVQ